METSISPQTYQGFLDSCVKSGPLGCALATNGTTSEQLGDRIHKLRVDLRDKPLAVPTSASGPGIVTASDIEYSVSDLAAFFVSQSRNMLNLTGLYRFSTRSMVPKPGQSLSTFIVKRVKRVSSTWFATPRPALAVALHDLENGNGRRIYELNNPVGASAKKDPSDNVFHRSMIGSMASTAVRNFFHLPDLHASLQRKSL